MRPALLAATALGMWMADARPMAAATMDFVPLVAPEIRDATPLGPPANVGEGLSPDLKRQLESGSAALSDGDFSAAEAAARAVISAAPDRPDAYYLLGLALANLGQMDGAIAALTDAADRYARNSQPLIVKGDILLSLGRRDEARAAYTDAVTRDPAAWQAQESLGVMAEQDGDAEAAMTYYVRASAAAPAERLFPRVQLARLSLLAGKPDDALTVLDPIVQAGLANGAVLEVAARAALAKNDSAAARTYLEGLVAEGTSAFGFSELARLETQEQDFDGAEATLRAGRAVFPQNPALALELGNLLGAQRRYDEALAAYGDGLALVPGDAALTKASSIAEMRLGRIDDALAKAADLASREGHGDGDLVWLATLQEMSGDRQAAGASYESALALREDNVVALNNLAALIVEDDPARALDLAQKAAALAPGNTAIQDTLGWAYFKTGDYDMAERVFSGLVIEDPRNPTAAYRLGRARLAKGDTATARADLRRALALDPGFPYAAEARALLGQN